MFNFKANYKTSKHYLDIKKGDMLQRKEDGLFYEIKNITNMNGECATESRLYSFYGFIIQGTSNLSIHFKNFNGRLEVFE